MPMVRAMRMLNAVEAGTTNGAALQALLADSGRLGEWQVLMSMRGQSRRMAASNTAMAAVVASSTAWGTVLASEIALSAVFSSSVALTALAANSAAVTALFGHENARTTAFANATVMGALLSSATAKTAIYDSDAALNAIAASSTAMAACRAAAGYEVKSWTENNTTTVGLSLPGTKYIVLGASGAGGLWTAVFGTRRSGSTISATTPKRDGTADALAKDFNVAIPITSPFTAGGGVSGTGYVGLLRCDA